MDLYGAHARSLPQKLIIIAAQLVVPYVSYRTLFGDWGSAFQAKRYGDEYAAYARSTRMIVPFVY